MERSKRREVKIDARSVEVPSTHRGWRGNRGRREEIFDRNRPIKFAKSPYFYFNTSGINILAFVVWHLVSRAWKIFVQPNETDYDTGMERFGDNSFTGGAGEKDWQEEAGHPSSSRYIFADLMDRPGQPLRHTNIPGNTRDDRLSFRSEQLHQPRPQRIDGRERRFVDSLGTRDLSLDLSSQFGDYTLWKYTFELFVWKNLCWYVTFIW